MVVVAETRDRSASSSRSRSGAHHFLADEPVSSRRPRQRARSPTTCLLAGLGACTAMTLRIYAERKALPLERVTVTLRHAEIHAADCDDLRDQGREARPHRAGDRARRRARRDAQRARLLEIADKCPVHRTLTSEIDVRTTLGLVVRRGIAAFEASADLG